MIFVVAAILAVAVCFSGMPAALNRANEEHVRNGRQPNAGVAFAPDLLVMIPLWCIGVLLVDQFIGRSWAWIVLLVVSAAFLVLNFRQSKRSARDFSLYLNSRSDAVWPSYVNGMFATHCWTHPGGNERLFLIERSDGAFSTDYEQFSSDEYENCWIPYGPGSIYDTEETAIKEAKANHPWIEGVEPKKREAPQSVALNRTQVSHESN